MTTPPKSSTVEHRGPQMFPHLAPHHLAELESLGERRRFPAGTLLFQEGDRHIGMWVVLQGAIDITRRTDSGEEPVTTHLPGQFSGDVGLLSGRGAVVSGRAREDTEALFLDEAAVRHIMVRHAELSELFMRAFILRRVAMLENQSPWVTIVGSRLASDTHRLRHFLTRNGIPHRYLDLEHDPATRELLAGRGVTAEELPVAIIEDRTLRRPSIRELADAIGLSPDRLDGRQFDVAVIGAGPAGLAAAVYAASEGLSVIVLDAKAPGGQAGSSSKIENYFGFPTGISGQALAGRGFTQAQKFGAEVGIPRQVVGFECGGGRQTLAILDSGERVAAHTMVIATGAKYRKLALPNLESFEGRGVYYGASNMERQLCAGQDVIIVGGGNSAGQAAVYLATEARQVHVVVRAASLASSMSDYLIQRINATPNIALHTRTEIVALHGDGALAGVDWRRADGGVESLPIEHLFLFCGASPSTQWLGKCLTLDKAGFVKTGTDLTADDLTAAEWPLARSPMRLETSHPGVFAVGDVRSGSVKRVAAAVGEGSTAVQLVHLYLAEQQAETAGRA